MKKKIKSRVNGMVEWDTSAQVAATKDGHETQITTSLHIVPADRLLGCHTGLCLTAVTRLFMHMVDDIAPRLLDLVLETLI